MTGSGTLLDPYVIWDVTDLQNMELDLAAYYELGQDIDALATAGWNGGAGFIPIGAGAPYFTGQLDGKDHTISDLYINRSGLPVGGLFSWIDGVGGWAIVQNVKMVDVDITGDRPGYGALASQLRGGNGRVINCSSTGSIDVVAPLGFQAGGLIGIVSLGARVTESWSSCSVTINGDWAGGLIGDLGIGAVSESYATGDVSVDDYGGGLIGRATGGAFSTVDDCYATGAVFASGTYAGGFIGDNVGTLNNCYSVGAVSVGVSDPGGFCADNTGTITDCFWDTVTSGQAVSDGGTGKNTAEMKTQTTFTDDGWDFTTIWDIDGLTNNGYPFFAVAVVPAPSGSNVGAIALLT